MTMFWVWVLMIGLSVVAVVGWIGSRLPKTHIAASRIRLAVSPEEVWRVITDFSAHPDWRPGLERVDPGPDIDGLPSWYEICARARVHFRVVESAPPRRLVTRLVGEGLPLSGTWVYELVPVGEGETELVITEQDRIYSPFFRFATRFILAYHGVMDVFLIALARAFGQDAQPEHLSLRQESAAGES